MNANSRLQIHHVVLETAFDNLVVFVALVAEALPGIFTHAMQAQHLDSGRILLVARQDHAAFAGHNVLSRIKAEAAEITKGTGLASFVLCFDGVCAILDQLEMMAAGDLADGIHLAGAASKVHRQQCASAWRDLSLNLSRINIEGAGIDVGQDRSAPSVQNGIHRGAEGHRRRNDLVSGFDSRSQNAQMQRRRAGVQCQRVGGAFVGRKLSFKARYAGTGAQPARLQNRHYFIDFRLFDAWCTEDEEFFPLIGQFRFPFLPQGETTPSSPLAATPPPWNPIALGAADPAEDSPGGV